LLQQSAHPDNQYHGCFREGFFCHFPPASNFKTRTFSTKLTQNFLPPPPPPPPPPTHPIGPRFCATINYVAPFATGKDLLPSPPTTTSS
jgi:hypothetical protein